jgi:hypothetical protein
MTNDINVRQKNDCFPDLDEYVAGNVNTTFFDDSAEIRTNGAKSPAETAGDVHFVFP